MKLTCIIVDDEPVARKLLEEYIGDIDFLDLAGKAENPLKANSLLNDNRVDLMFLDINMPKLSGIEFLRTSTTLPPAIMTTAYSEYAIEGFELDVLDYLVKPFSFERFLKACNKAREFYALKRRAGDNDKTDGNDGAPGQDSSAVENYFFVKCDGRIEKVLYEELIYIEAMLNYVILHTETKKMIVYLTIKSIAEQLPAHVFLKIHKSTIVNIHKIRSIEGKELDMGKSKVLISQGLQEEVMKAILKDRMIKR
jgi:DNA-binding LytR/AlgR family response regulator